jgi:Domain of unknown function (DUF5063)
MSASAAEDFAAIARRFCATIEELRGVERLELLWGLAELLPLLYAAAVELPDVEPTSAEAASDAVSADQWKAVTRGLGEVLGRDAYATVLEPLGKADDATFASLTDDLGDIYRDLKVGLGVLDDGSPKDAIWEWRFGFSTHWGRHAVEALRAIHALLEHEGFMRPGREEAS